MNWIRDNRLLENLMKILAILGSPRNGDSARIIRRLEEKLKELGGVEFETIHLKDLQIQPCRGCFLCTARGETHCPLQDDCPAVLEKMLEADGVIFASPVHALSVSSLMKAFKDRLAYNAYRPRFFGKYALAVATSAGTGLDGALGYLSTFSLWGFEVVEKLGFICYPGLQPTPALEKQMEMRLDKAARKFHQAIRERKPRSPSLAQVLQFHVLKCNTRVAGGFWEADREFYRDRRDYFYETRISPLHRLAAGLFEKFYMGYMRKNYILDQAD
jgi:NAD(P)H-dependent FMN reductase